MKIINMTEFRKLPPFTLFAKYRPYCFGDLEIKGATWPSDFITSGSLSGCVLRQKGEEFFEIMERMENGESVPFDPEDCGRDGLFDKAQLFAVWEKSDVENLIGLLEKCRQAAQ